MDFAPAPASWSQVNHTAEARKKEGQKNMEVIPLSWFSISFSSNKANKIYYTQNKELPCLPCLSASRNPTGMWDKKTAGQGYQSQHMPSNSVSDPSKKQQWFLWLFHTTISYKSQHRINLWAYSFLGEAECPSCPSSSAQVAFMAHLRSQGSSLQAVLQARKPIQVLGKISRGDTDLPLNIQKPEK